MRRAQSYLFDFGVDFHLSGIPDTTAHSCERYLMHTHDSKSGPNGIPYAAYNFFGKVAFSIFATT